jgi:hypothetical protein
VHGESADGQVTTGDGEIDGRVVGASKGSTLRRGPAPAVIESTSYEHDLDPDEITEDPTDLGPGVRASDQNGRASGEGDRPGDVQPASQQRVRRRGRRRGAHTFTIRLNVQVVRDNGARPFRCQNRRAVDVWPPQPIAKKLVRPWPVQ